MPNNLADFMAQVTGALLQIVPSGTILLMIGAGGVITLAALAGKRLIKIGR